MKKYVLFIIFLIFIYTMNMSGAVNQFNKSEREDSIIFEMPLGESDADSVYQQILPLTGGVEYAVMSSENCETQMSDVMRLRDMEFSVLSIIPDLDLRGSDVMRVELSGGSVNSAGLTKPAGSFLQMYMALFPELAERENWRELEITQPNILYIYPDTDEPSFWEVFDYLLEWKRQRGFKVFEYATNTTSCSAIKDYIQDAYDNWEEPPEYICIIGDAGGMFSIPTAYFEGGEGDHYYTTLAGNDQISDVHIGRLSFNSISEWQTIVYKIIMYEREPYMDNPSWFNRVLLTGDPTNSGMSCVYTNVNIRELIENNHPEYSYLELYEAPFMPAMQGMVNQGVSYFNYRGFWGMSGWYEGSADFLNNGMMLPFAVISTCATGDFAGEGSSRSESFIRAGTSGSPRGGIGAIGTATSATHTCFNNCFAMGVAYGLFAEDLQTMGAAHTRGKTSLWLNYPQNPSDASLRFSYWNNLIGDPAIAIWQGTPENIIVERTDHYTREMNTVTLRMLNEYGDGVEGLYCCLFNTVNSEQHFIYSDDEGYAVFLMDELISDDFAFTVSGDNIYPEQELIMIEEEIELAVSDYTLEDESGNNSLEPGETGIISLVITNNSDTDIQDVSVSLSCDPQIFTLADNEINIDVISAGESVEIGDIEISYFGDSENYSVQYVEVTVESSACSLEDSYPVELTLLDLAISEYTIYDNNNNEPEPGETINIDYTLINEGEFDLDEINLEISCSSNLVNIAAREFLLGSIISGDTFESEEPLILTIAEEYIGGNELEVSFRLFNEAGYEQTLLLVFLIGESEVSEPTGPDAFGYCIFDAADIAYMPVEYFWYEINTGAELPLVDGGDAGTSCQVNIPFSFRFYDQAYDILTVCSNGWVTPGYTEGASFMNWAIPGEGGISPIIAVFWDDLVINANSGVYTQYIEEEHIFVVEWDHLTNDWDGSEETFELIIYDREFFPTSNGNNMFKLQYKEFNNVNEGTYEGYHEGNHGQYATIGIEDQQGIIGLQYSYNNDYPVTGSELYDQNALVISGEPIPSGSEWLVIDDTRYYNLDGEEIVTPGDTINIVLGLRNIGDVSSGELAIEIINRTEGNLELITNELVTSGIEAGEISEAISGLIFMLGDDFPPQETIVFDLNIQSNDMMWNYRITGEVTAPLIEIPVETIDLGEVMCGYASEYELLLRNSGSALLEILEITSSSNDLSTNFESLELAAGEEEILIITCLTEENGEFSEVLTITSNSIISGILNIPVTGDVMMPPEIEIDSNTLYVNAEEGLTDEFPIEISNIGEGTLAVSASIDGYYNSGNGALFSGGYLNLSEPVLTGSEFSIEAWARVDGPGFHQYGTNTILEQRDDAAEDYRAITTLFARTISGSVTFSVQGAESTGTVLLTEAPPYGEWHHYVGTVSQDIICLYLDGQLMATESNFESGGYEQGASNVDIGAHRFNGELKAGFNGMIDEVRVWNRSLSSGEVQEHQYVSIFPYQEGLTSYWTFNEQGNWQDMINNDLIVTPVLQVEQLVSYAPLNDWSALDANSLLIGNGETEIINLIIDASYLELGEQYETCLYLETNDPQADSISIPVIISVTQVSEAENEVFPVNHLQQNYPNPFYNSKDGRDGTTIEYSIAEDVEKAVIIIYNIKGQRVKSYPLDLETSRKGSINWNGLNSQNRLSSSGVYCYVLRADSKIMCPRKLLIIN